MVAVLRLFVCLSLVKTVVRRRRLDGIRESRAGVVAWGTDFRALTHQTEDEN